jgi:uncharacterized protein
MTRTVTLRKRNGEVVCERCGLADRMLPRMRGLLGRRNLERNEGLLLRPAPSIQTFFMRFPIDVVFLDQDLTVLKIRKHMGPWRTAARFRARSVLELASGECDRLRLELGDQLAFEQ